MPTVLKISSIWDSDLLQIRKRRGIFWDAICASISFRSIFWSNCPAISSTASMMTSDLCRRRSGLSRRSFSKTCTRSLSNWTSMDLAQIERSVFSVDSRCGHISGMDRASCHASVGDTRSATPRSDVFLSKKKDAASCVSLQCSAMVWAIADFPAPAGPFNPEIRWDVFGSLIQSVIIFKTSTRVPG